MNDRVLGREVKDELFFGSLQAKDSLIGGLDDVPDGVQRVQK